MNKLEKEDPRKEAERQSWDLVYIPYEKIEDYNACYRVEYQGEAIYPPAADDLGIPLNEIWISEKLEEFERYILYHEIREIKYRAEVYDGSTVNEKAVEAEKIFEGDSKWEKLRREINMVSPEIFQKVAGIDSNILKEIMENRPYYQMKELRNVNGIDEKKYKKLKENFWSFY